MSLTEQELVLGQLLSNAVQQVIVKSVEWINTLPSVKLPVLEYKHSIGPENW